MQKDSNSKLGKFNGWNYNYATVPLNVDYGQIDGTFLSTYSCVNLNPNPSTKGTTPIANFASVDNFVSFMTARLQERVPQVLTLGLVKYYACYWPVKNVSESTYDSHTKEYTETKETFDKALTSALSVGVATKAIVEDLKNQINKVEGQGTTNGVPNTVVVTSQLACPPTSITSFSPLSGNTGTIVQVNGVSFNGTTSITVNGVSVPETEFTVFNDTTLRFNTPIIGTGTVVNKGKIVIVTPNGTVTSETNYTFDPAITASSAASPGGYNNPQNQTTNLPLSETVNTNPQETGPITLNTIVDSKNNLGGTSQLTVKVNPDAGDWNIDTLVNMNYRVVCLVPGPNNTYIENQEHSTNNYTLQGYVSADKKQFSISETQMISDIDLDLTDYTNPNVKLYGTINLTAIPVDKVKNPQNVRLPYNFNIFFTNKKVGDAVINDVPTQQASITRVGDFDTINGNGPQYFNIVKPSGGYITFKFTIDQFDDNNYGINEILNASNKSVLFGEIKSSSTGYTYVYDVNALGVLKLVVKYTPIGLPEIIVYGPTFTL